VDGRQFVGDVAEQVQVLYLLGPEVNHRGHKQYEKRFAEKEVEGARNGEGDEPAIRRHKFGFELERIEPIIFH
jgi:hypothetical protein